MTSAAVFSQRAATAVRTRRSILLASVLIAGCVLLTAGVVLTVQGQVATPSPSVEIRAHLPSLTSGGQSTGFAVAPDGSLGIVDRLRQRVVRLDSTGQVVAEWDPRFEDNVPATDLDGLAADSNGDWYLLDRGQLRILRLDENGQAIASIDLRPLATYGPNGLAVDRRGDIYLADTGRARVLVFGPNGVLANTIGSAGSGPGQLKQPVSIALGTDGGLYVADSENRRIEHWDAGGQPANNWPLPTPPLGLAVDRLGRVFVPDFQQHSVRMFDSAGRLLAEIGSQSSTPLPLTRPSQVQVAPDGSALWVLGDDGLARIDLSPFADIAPPAQGRQFAAPLTMAGIALVLCSLVALGQPAVQRWRRWATTTTTLPRTPPPRGMPVWPALGGRVTTWLQLEHFDPPLGGVMWAGVELLVLGGLGAAGALGAMGASAAKADPWPLFGLLLGGGLVWAVGCSATERVVPPRWVASPTRAAVPALISRVRRRVWLVGVAALLGVLAAGMWWVSGFENASASRAALVWLAGVALAVLACVWGPASRPRSVALVALGLFVLALLPRIWQVADVPYGIWYDEAQGALEIRRVVEHGTYTPILQTYGRDTSGFFYLMPALAEVLGDNIFSARLAAALVGALTVAVTYLLGRELFGWRVGLAAGALLALMRWHLDFSRLAFNPISLPLAAVVAFWLLARAMRRGRWTDFALAGLGLGLGLHAYTGYRVMPLVALLVLGYAALVQRWPLATFAGRTGLYSGGAVLIGLPVVIFALQHPADYNARTVQTLILAAPVDNAVKVQQLWENLQKHVLMFNVSGDMNGRHNLPGAPMLDPLSGGLVVFGMGLVVLRARDWRSVLLLAWAGAALASGIVTLAFEAPTAVRTIAITPVLAILAGLGLVVLLDRFVALVTVS
ncbi:MAG: glycosyltransferase family 39 protein, partial [Chloroflexi bacterium]|nr:glycosyltransferase family 39 protein [Chloroflexota bacterium]